MTDLAYYSSFEKEVDGMTSKDIDQFQAEEFVPSSMYEVHCFSVSVLVCEINIDALDKFSFFYR